MENEFCDFCKHLNPKEDHPTKGYHHCEKYNKRVMHLGHYPHICRLDECKKEGGFETVYGIHRGDPTEFIYFDEMTKMDPKQYAAVFKGEWVNDDEAKNNR